MAVNGKYVKVDRIFERVHSDFGLEQLNVSDAIEWIGSIMARSNVPYVMKHRVAYITIEDGRGELPCDLNGIIQTAKVANGQTLGINVPKVFFLDADELALENVDSGNFLIESNTSEVLLPMRWSSDTFHMRWHIRNIDWTADSSITYIVNDSAIFPNFNDGTVAMSYLAVPTDEETGLPLIPDDERWIDAAVLEVAWKHGRKQFFMGELDRDRYNELSRERNHYYSQAVIGSKMNSIDKDEGTRNRRGDLYRTGGHHNNFFRNYQLPGSFKAYRW